MKLRKRKSPLSWLPLSGGVVAVLVLCGQLAVSGANIVSQKAHYDTLNNTAYFYLTFDAAPDLFSADQYGRQADGFQFFINSGQGFQYPGNTLIRGGEINAFGDIPIQNSSPSVARPTVANGGWGSTLGYVPFTLSGDTLDFSVPGDFLGISGAFSYDLLGTCFGGGNYDIDGEASVGRGFVPESASRIVYLISFAGILLLSWHSKRKQTFAR